MAEDARAGPLATRWDVGWGRATFGYALLACVVTWPLPRFIGSRFLGDTAGDLGVYVWNVWIFSHELLEHGHLPYSTDHVFAFTGGLDFALHNYTPIVGLLGVPLLEPLGIVATFNLLLLASIAATGLAMYALARRLGSTSLAAWVAGAIFAASPVLVARETAHTSLVLAAPLPLFLCALLRALERGRKRDGVLVGATVALATYSDAYFGVYCLLMGLVFVAGHFLRLGPRTRTAAPTVSTRLIDVVLVVAVIAIAWRLLSGTTVLTAGPVHVSMRTLYTPMLVVVLTAGLRWWQRRTFAVHLRDRMPGIRALVPAGAVAIVVTLALLAPLLAGIARRAAEGRLPETPTYWRSSPRGVDVLSLAIPNPNLRWLGGWNERALMPPLGDAFPEFVGAFPLVALGIVVAAARRRTLPAFWVAFSAFFAALALGPFVHVAGINTQAIGPWALLRYVPIVGLARAPSRFAIIATLGLCVLVAFAVDAYLRAGTTWRRTALLAGALAVELLPVPRVLHAADVPPAYEFIAEDTARPGRVLELPTGIRDGTSSLGNFRASTMYYQTVHGRPLLGGYVSRVSEWRRREHRRDRVFGALHTLSDESASMPMPSLADAIDGRREFLARTCLAFVIVDLARASAELRGFSREALRLETLYADAEYEVLAPMDPPPCAAPSRPEHPRRHRKGHPRSPQTSAY